MGDDFVYLQYMLDAAFAVQKSWHEQTKPLKDFKNWLIWRLCAKKSFLFLTCLENFSYLCGLKREDQHCFEEEYFCINRIYGIFLVQTHDDSRSDAPPRWWGDGVWLWRYVFRDSFCDMCMHFRGIAFFST